MGAGLTSNAGVLGNISYEQRNFDITNVPSSLNDLFSRKAFTRGGAVFPDPARAGHRTDAARCVTFEEPWMFDQPYSFRSDLYYSTRQREHWDETRAGAAFTLGHTVYQRVSARGDGRGEDVFIHAISDDFHRAPEIIANKGHHTLTSLGLAARYDTHRQQDVAVPRDGG